jgi:hypothetical protein
MKKAIIFACSIMLFIQTANANIITECIYEVLKEKLETTVDDNFKSPQYWGELLGNTAKGTPEVTVSQIMDDYSVKSIGSEIGLKMLGKILPRVASPIGLLIQVSDVAHSYTNGMLDSCEQMRYYDFKKQVLERSHSKKQLKNYYDDFRDIDKTTAGVLRTRRNKFEEKYHNIYLQAVASMVKHERAKKAKELTEALIISNLKKMQKKIKSRVKQAMTALERAEMPKSKKNIKLYLDNSDFGESVKIKIKEVIQKRILQHKGIYNYSPYVKDYSEWISDYTNGNVGKKTFQSALENINSAVYTLNTSCLKKSITDFKKSDKMEAKCNEGLRNYKKQTQKLNATLRQKRMEMISHLTELKKVNAKTPSSAYREMQKKYKAASKQYTQYLSTLNSCNEKMISGSEVKELSKKIKNCKNAVSGLSTLTSASEDGLKNLKNTIDIYAKAFKNSFTAYNDYFLKHAEFLDSRSYSFVSESNEVANSTSLLYGYNIKKQGSINFTGAPTEEDVSAINNLLEKTENRELPYLNEQISLNQTFVTASEALLKDTKKAYEYTSSKLGKTINLNKDNFFKDYYHENFDKTMYSLSESMPILSHYANGNPSDSEVRINIRDKSFRPNEVPKQYNKTIAEHKKILAGFKKAIAEVKSMNLLERKQQAGIIINQEYPLASAIQIKSSDAETINKKFENLENFWGKLIDLTKKERDYTTLFDPKNITFSHETLTEMANTYEGTILQAENRTKKMNITFTGNKSNDAESGRRELEVRLIKKLYANFATAYQNKNISGLTKLLSDSWETQDGNTTIDDLKENLRNNFRLYNKINCSITNLKIQPSEHGIDYSRYFVTYTITIKSKIYRRNLTHEEKSSVGEIIYVDMSKETARIETTTSGNYWYVK